MPSTDFEQKSESPLEQNSFLHDKIFQYKAKKVAEIRLVSGHAMSRAALRATLTSALHGGSTRHHARVVYALVAVCIGGPRRLDPGGIELYCVYKRSRENHTSWWIEMPKTSVRKTLWSIERFSSTHLGKQPTKLTFRGRAGR